MKTNIRYFSEGTHQTLTVEKIVNGFVVAAIYLREKDGHKTVFIRGKRDAFNAQALLKVFLGYQVKLNHIS